MVTAAVNQRLASGPVVNPKGAYRFGGRGTSLIVPSVVIRPS